MAVDEPAAAVISQIFDGLVTLDPVTGAPAPELAGKWEVDGSGSVYTFSLRHNARFHNGRRVDADDVIFSFERLLAPATRSPHSWILSGITGSRSFREGRSARLAGIQSVNPSTVRIELERPFGPFLSLLALEPASILPREIYSDPSADTTTHPIGAGPFELGAWERGALLELRASGFHHEGPPSVRHIRYSIIPSFADAVTAYDAGLLDVLDDVPAGSREEIHARLGGEMRSHARPAVAFLAFNHQRPPFQGNRSLRKAFNCAIDRRSLCEVEGETRHLPAATILPPGIAGHDPEADGYPYDPARARRLLAQAGYPEGRGLPEITLAYSGSRNHRIVCRKIRDDLGAVGVKVALRELTTGELMGAIQEQPSDGSELVMFRMAWLADYPDPDAFLRPTLHSSSPPASGNFGRYANSRFDQLLDHASAEPDVARRLRLYRRAGTLAMDDGAWVLLYHYGDEVLVKPHIANLIFPTFGELHGPLHRVVVEAGAREAGF
jgi:peptide/nickel transport system substrate-binding protein/oligopeptide transport system substrate-binding protein